MVLLDEILDYIQPGPYIVTSDKYDNNFSTPVLTAGKSFLLGYTNETNGIYNASKDNPIILFDDFTTEFKWVDFPFKVKSSACKILKPKNDSIVLKYVYYAMKMVNIDTELHKRYWISIFSKQSIIYPDKEIQLRIVDILDSLSNIIDDSNSLLKKCDDLVKSRYIEMFGDNRRVKLGDYIEQIRGVSYKPADLGDSADDSHTTLLRANNISNNEINFDELQFVSDSKVQATQLINMGDILVCGSSGSKEHVGKAALCKFNGKYTYGAFCKLIRATKELGPVYISEYFRTDEYRDYIRLIACGSNINNLRNEHIDNISIPYPDPEEQKRFVLFVEQIDKSKFNLQQQIKHTQELLDSKMAECFSEKED